MRPLRHGVLFVVVATVGIAWTVARAHADGGDPASCGTLRAVEDRCCALGQTVEGGRCVGVPSSCPRPLALVLPGWDGMNARGATRGAARRAGCALLANERESTVTIAAGKLVEGASDWEAFDRITPREAEILRFRVDRYEATEASWDACVDRGVCPRVELSGEPGRPVVGMTQQAAATYCRWRGGELPTDDQWTFLAAGPKMRRYPWGDTGAVCRRAVWGRADGPCRVGGTGPELAGTHPDGATPEGVEDLAGNVAEWTRSDGAGSASGHGAGAFAHVRGGSFRDSFATAIRTWFRRDVVGDVGAGDIGVRCVYPAPPG